MFVAVIADDIGSAVWSVAEDIAAGRFFKGSKHLLGKAVRVGRERFVRDETCDLPVPYRGVFAAGDFRQTP